MVYETWLKGDERVTIYYDENAESPLAPFHAHGIAA